MQDNYIEQATNFWSSGNSLEAGRILYEHIPSELRPGWAANILHLCRSLRNPIAELDAVFEIAQDSSRWLEAYDAFRRLRKLVLQVEKMRVNDRIYLSILSLGENTAKVTYNSSGGPAPFDHDAGWWIVQNLKTICDEVQDQDFALHAWAAATSALEERGT